jgi:hypothetical protein
MAFSGAAFYSTHKTSATKLSIGGSRFATEIAATELSREQGLSGRSNLDQNKAMLFTFDGTGTRCIWMRDMNFSIDIVWLNKQNQVTSIEQNVTPASYPSSFCHEGYTVVEFAAGTVERLNIKLGDQADL